MLERASVKRNNRKFNKKIKWNFGEHIAKKWRENYKTQKYKPNDID